MYYRHDLDIKYPEKSDEHMICVKRKRTVVLDENYPYVPKSAWFKFKRVIYWLLLNLIVFPLMLVTHGLKIYGKENLKKHKKELKNGAITISNHVFMWDYLCVLKAIRPRLAFFPAWKDNLEGGFGGAIRLSGGVPIPTESHRAMIEFKKAMDGLFKQKKWVHFFPEGSLWFFYPDIRPFKKAVFKYAVKYDKPIIPISMSFRKRKGLLKLFGKTPMIDMHIGEPIFANKELSIKEKEEDLHKRAYHLMQVQNGINKGDKTYNDNPFISQDEYKKTM
ncbi:MAG: 1-acyl-sn-glycerol-3-phosphate acyltransferase [Clostridiales bacterium]|nr:1-acyl-sn-glycerol-3-phosphate acyltransferase [Clostridiales bacterium]